MSGVGRSEIRVAKRDVSSTGSDLLANICQNDIFLDDKEATTIYRSNRAVRARMQTAAGCFGVACLAHVISIHQMGIHRHGRQVLACWHRKPLPRQSRVGSPIARADAGNCRCRVTCFKCCHEVAE